VGERGVLRNPFVRSCRWSFDDCCLTVETIASFVDALPLRDGSKVDSNCDGKDLSVLKRELIPLEVARYAPRG